jgi:hypothetical protein
MTVLRQSTYICSGVQYVAPASRLLRYVIGQAGVRRPDFNKTPKQGQYVRAAPEVLTRGQSLDLRPWNSQAGKRQFLSAVCQKPKARCVTRS